MIEHDRRSESAEISCDHCSWSESLDGDFSNIIEQMKEDGWHITKTPGGEWDHKCPACVEEENEIEDFI